MPTEKSDTNPPTNAGKFKNQVNALKTEVSLAKLTIDLDFVNPQLENIEHNKSSGTGSYTQVNTDTSLADTSIA